MATRLTNDLRDAIARKLIKHAHQASADAVAAQVAAFADAAYRHALTGDQIATINALPDGWLQVRNRIDVSVGYYRDMVHFSGHFSGAGDGIDTPLSAGRRVVDWIYRNGVQIEADTPLAAQWEKMRAAISAHADRVKVDRRNIDSALRAVATVEKLIEVWPEAAPFASGCLAKPQPKLPAIPVATLNAALGLPVGEVAA